MRKNFLLPLLLPVLVVLFSCKKDHHYPYPLEHRKHRIKQVINFSKLDFEPDTLTFYYDKKGNPTRIIRNKVGTGKPNIRFNYDAKGRLYTYVSEYEAGGDFTEFARKFFYDANNRVIADSVYVYAGVNEDVFFPAPPYNVYGLIGKTSYFYDNQDRIIRLEVERGGSFPGHDTYHFTYNSNGNLNTYTIWDNNVNPRRLHPVWQLISHDYSVNNPFTTATYNDFKLPIQTPGVDNYLNDVFLYDIPLSNSKIVYE
ncbi:hypothetical protein SAMN05444266_106243 [Chitinophaga jiangningensis]|uniref:YD repeat-containing protein n=1 Tax=Chitinophaga jiangningensis TaxID=1419482 RepID=A0A1M7FQY2_9BACT|nr:hypothetical protein [Chitinophaga jiangningensis]SHM06491.1 hypothetical protein SAMN05444266_106243 [Chitinophaga jiangningensis]